MAILDGNNKMKRIIQDKQLLIRRIFLMCYDMLAVFAASILALLVRFDFHIMSVPSEYLDEVWRTIPYMAVMTLIIFWVLRLYSSLWSYAGALEMMYVVSACVVDAIANVALILIRNWGDMFPVPRSFYVLYGIFLFILVMGCRYSYRGLRVLRNMRRAGVYRRNVLVIGAGDAGNQIIKEISNSRYVRKKVVGVIDDDRNKIGNYIHGAKVVGDRNDILAKVQELHVHEIIIAMPSANQK
ncbi:MAG: polysaccharide biosynthesis protein, partial [Lachnospiraceae bacterium]|nr:polysaccharide biosynthesis protein [Lachnospiraceae bacterium]